MTRQNSTQTQQQTATTSPLSSGILQRQCISCGQHTIAGGECSQCQKKQSPLQRRAINGENISDVPPLDSYPLIKSCFHHDFSHIPVHTATSVLIQPKLTINTVGDRYEQEADRIADEVMRMPEPSVQRQLEPEAEEQEMVQRKATFNQVTPLKQGQDGTEMPSLVHEVLNSPGQPLDPDTRTFMEPRFNHDFSQVRVHTDPQAAESARVVQARAYTVGHNIIFGAGQYAPTSRDGRRLLAHELTHVIQQRSGVVRLQRYDESTEPNTRLGQLVADVLFNPLGLGRLVYAGVCLSNLEKPMGSITFGRWIPDVCRRTASHILHSREWDAFGHCWIGCEGSRRCGETPTALAGTVREFYREAQRILRIRPHDSFQQDLANQRLGRTLSFTRGTCYMLCDNAHRTGTLNLTAPVGTCINCSSIGRGEVSCPPP